MHGLRAHRAQAEAKRSRPFSLYIYKKKSSTRLTLGYFSLTVVGTTGPKRKLGAKKGRKTKERLN